MSIKVKKINDVKVKKIETVSLDDREIKGKDICSTCTSNIFLVAPTHGGKTTTMFEIIQQCAGKKTKIVAFVSTIFNDENWAVIKEWCRKKRISFTPHISIFEGKKDLLQEYVLELTKKAEEKEKLRNTPIDPYESCIMFDNDDEDEEEEDKKYQYPEYIFIFDDLSDEIRTTSYNTLLKKSRHFGIMTITGTQDVKDMLPATRNQIRIWLLYPDLPPDRLDSIYNTLGRKINFSQFEQMYKYATKQPYNFLYIAPRNADYRINFDRRYILPEKK
jgi:hypothetical protein